MITKNTITRDILKTITGKRDNSRINKDIIIRSCIIFLIFNFIFPLHVS